MAASLEVEIEHRRYVELCPAVRRAEGRLSITTLEPGQRRAQVKLFVATPSGRTPVETIPVDDLPAYEDRLVPMQLTGVVRRGGKLSVRLYVEGSLFLERTVPVGRYIRPSSSLIAAMVLALLLLVGALGALFISRFQADVYGPDTLSESDESVDRVDAANADQAQSGDPDPGEAEAPADAEDSDAEDVDGADDDQARVAETDGEDADAEDVDGADGDQARVAETDGGEIAAVESEQPIAVEPLTHIVYFTPESAALTGDTLAVLSSIADRLSGHDLPVRVDGHTAIAGSMEGRVQLSRRRAETVRDYLVTEGVDPERFSELNAFGAAQPVTRDPDDQDRNRRVEIIEIEDRQ